MSAYYAYVHAKPSSVDARGIFYVGKGKGRRCYAFNRKSQNPYYARIVAKYGDPLVGKLECSTESLAFELERGLIKCFRRMGVKLTNLSDGGEGQSGYRHSKETKYKLAVTSKNWPRPKSLCEKIAKRQLGLKNSAKLPGVGQKISAALSGRVWVTDGVEDSLQFKSDIQPGWKLGRSKYKRPPDLSKFVGVTKGTMWITNGIENKRTAKDSALPDNWHIGRSTPWQSR